MLMADKKESDVTGNLAESIQETNRKIAQSLAAAQERNIKFAQSTFESAMEVLKGHMESTRTLMKEFEQQAQKQQEAFQKAIPGMGAGAGSAHMDPFRAPMATYQKALELTENAAEQGLENFQKAMENLQHLTKQGLEEMQKAASQAQHAARDTKEK
jgi:hypothetical protein